MTHTTRRFCVGAVVAQGGSVASHVLRIELNARTFVIALAMAAAAWLLIKLSAVVLVIVVALMLVGMLNPVVDKLEARGMRRHLAIGTVFAAVLVAIVGACAFAIPRIVSQAGEVLHRFPQVQADLAGRLDAVPALAPLSKSVRELKPEALSTHLAKWGWAYSGTALNAVAYGASTLFLSLYLLLDRDRMRGGLFAIVPRAYHVRLSRLLLSFEGIVSGYLRGQLITSALMAVFTFAVLTIAHVPNALVLALIAGVADVLPYVGAILACGPACLGALGNGMTTAVVVLVLLAAYQELESRFIIPRVYGGALRLPASIVMVSLLIGGTLLGIMGALLALPIAAGIRAVVEELRVDLPGEVTDDAVVRARDAREERDFARRAAGTPAVEAAAIATEIVETRLAEEAERS